MNIPELVRETLAALEKKGTAKGRAGMARYGIATSGRGLGVAMGEIQAIGKRLGKNPELANALWETRCYEARLLCAYVADPSRITPAQMDRWCGDFDNWATCDTLCFALFDRTPHSWSKIAKWRKSRREFVKRAAFALLASVAGHDKKSGEEPFLASLPWIEAAATDDRNFVKKGVSWALRRIATRSQALHAASVELALRLAESPDAPKRWVGKDALRDITRPLVVARLQRSASRVRKGAGTSDSP